MEVITLHITSGAGEPDFSVWDSEKAAAKFACSLIAEVIDNEWDLGNPDMLLEAKQINEFILGGDYLEAVNYWNDSDVVCDRTYSHYYNIESERIRDLSDSGNPEIMNLEPEDLLGLPKLIDNLFGDHKSIQEGATCRKCNTHNEYAAPDKDDGTYVCRGCKGMAEVFLGS